LGFDFQFTRTYRSGMTFYGPLGHGWDHNYDKRITKSCDGTVYYSDGALNVIHFMPTGSVAGGKMRYTAPPGVALQLFENYLGTGPVATQSWTMLDSAGMESTFNPEGLLIGLKDLEGSASCAQGASCWRHTMAFRWEQGAVLGWRLQSVIDTVGRQIEFIYDDANTGTLQRLWLRTGVVGGDPDVLLASYQYNTDWIIDAGPGPHYGELIQTSDIRGRSMLYQYRADPAGIPGYVPSPALDATCASFCASTDPLTTCPPPVAVCRPDNMNCILLHNDLVAQCQHPNPNFPNIGPLPGVDCEKVVAPTVTQCQQALASTYPFCSSADGCVPACRAYYHSRRCNNNSDGTPVCVPEYWYGHPHELQHNLLRVYNGVGATVVDNTYDDNPTSPTFNKVISQYWGNSPVKLEYHDLILEASVLGAPPAIGKPVVHPNPNVLTPASFQMRTFCNATQASPAFAAVVTNIHGITQVSYYDSLWNNIREVNTANGETTDYVYDTLGFVSGVAHPSGIQTCTSNDTMGRPLALTTYPALGYPGNADPHKVAIVYDAMGALTDVFEDPDGLNIHTQIQRDALERPQVLHQQVDSTTMLTTVMEYAPAADSTFTEYWFNTPGYFAPANISADYLQTITWPNRGKTFFDQFSVDGAQPTVIKAGFGENSPLQTTLAFERHIGVPTMIRQPSGFELDLGYVQSGVDQGIVTAAPRVIQRRQNANDPSAPIDRIAFALDGAGRPVTLTGDTSSSNIKYSVSDQITATYQWPNDTSDPAQPRATCANVTVDGRLLDLSLPEGNRLHYDYDQSGRVTEMQKGYVPVFDITSDNLWIRECYTEIAARLGTLGATPLETIQRVTYRTGGFVDTIERDGIRRTVTVDGFGRPIEVSDGTGRRIRIGYDVRDQVIWTAVYDRALPAHAPYSLPQMGDRGLVAMTQFDYDYLGRQRVIGRWHIEDGTIAMTNIDRDDANRTIAVTEENRKTITTLDGVGRPLVVLLPNGATTSYQYFGNVVSKSVTTTAGVVTTVESYDGLGLLSQMTWDSDEVPRGQVPIHKQLFFENHDIDGQPLVRRFEGSLDLTFAYDAYRRLSSETQQFSSTHSATWQYSWDGNDRLSTVFDPHESGLILLPPDVRHGSYTFAYDAQDRIAQSLDPLGRQTSYQYDLGSERPNTMTSPTGNSQVWYDLAGRVQAEYLTNSQTSGWRTFA